MKDVSVVVVTYKEGLDILKACFDSVVNQTDVSWELIVVDNAASEATRGLLSSYPSTTYIRNASNRGFAAAVNQGMKRSNGRYILLLNPDTTCGPQVYSKMVASLDRDHEVGVASCVIRYPDGQLQESIRRFPGVIDQLLIMLKAPHIFKNLQAINHYMMREADALQTQDVESIMGAFMWIRREVIEKIGWFDERYFVWFEEVDYCRMVHNAGWKIRHYGDVEIMHHKGHAFNQISTLKKQKWIRTSLRKYLLKHEGYLIAGIFWALTPIFIILGWLASVIKPK